MGKHAAEQCLRQLIRCRASGSTKWGVRDLAGDTGADLYGYTHPDDHQYTEPGYLDAGGTLQLPGAAPDLQ